VKESLKVNESKNGLIVDVFVKPNCSKFGLVVEGEELIVCSTEEPTKGKVNREIVKELTRLLGRRVQIVFGLTSRQKKILIENYRKKDIETFLSEQ
jgi:uncharacterized protein